jgi:aconitase A
MTSPKADNGKRIAVATTSLLGGNRNFMARVLRRCGPKC